MPSEVRQKKIMEKLNRAQKCSILGPQNLGSGGAWAPGAPLDPHLHAKDPYGEGMWGNLCSVCAYRYVGISRYATKK